jgi:hypothetical protein
MKIVERVPIRDLIGTVRSSVLFFYFGVATAGAPLL